MDRAERNIRFGWGISVTFFGISHCDCAFRWNVRSGEANRTEEKQTRDGHERTWQTGCVYLAEAASNARCVAKEIEWKCASAFCVAAKTMRAQPLRNFSSCTMNAASPSGKKPSYCQSFCPSPLSTTIVGNPSTWYCCASS